MKKSALSILVLIVAWAGVVATSREREFEEGIDEIIASESGKHWTISKVLIDNDPNQPDDCITGTELTFFRNFNINERTVHTDSSRKKCNPNSKNNIFDWEPISLFSFRIKDGSLTRNIHLHTNLGDSLILFDTASTGDVKFMHLRAK